MNMAPIRSWWLDGMNYVRSPSAMFSLLAARGTGDCISAGSRPPGQFFVTTGSPVALTPCVRVDSPSDSLSLVDCAKQVAPQAVVTTSCLCDHYFSGVPQNVFAVFCDGGTGQ